MPNVFKKIVLSFLASLVLLFSFAPFFKANAAPNPPPPTPIPKIEATVNAGPASDSSTNWYDQGFWNWHAKVYDPSNSSEIFGERYTAAQVQWVIFGVFSQIINLPGPATTVAIVCITTNGILGCGTEVQNAVKSLTSAQVGPSKTAMAFFDSQPLSGIGYVRQKINNFHLIPEANAQGTGFTAANPIQSLWVAFRNLTFGLMVIVVLIMAFMIMFRVKISPQVVITVQSALPKIAGALVLITFSYAIAGFMIDIMYLVMGILASFLSSSSISTLSATEIFNTLNNGNILWLSLKYCVYFWFGMIEAFLTASGGGAGGTVARVISGEAALLGSFLGVIIMIIAAFLLLWYTVKIFWLLLKTYVTLLLQIALGPIQILLGTITPFGGFGAWLKSLAGSLAVYPVVGFMFALSYFFLAQAYRTVMPGDLLPFLGDFPFGININVLGDTSSWSPPLTGGADFVGILWLGVSLVVITLIPRTAEIIQGAISGKPFAFGTAIGEAFGPVMIAGQAAGDYKSGQTKARLEGEIKSAENLYGPADPRTLAKRQELANRDFTSNLLKRFMSGR